MQAWLSRVAGGSKRRVGGEGGGSQGSTGGSSSPGGGGSGSFRSSATALGRDGAAATLSAEDVAKGQQITRICEELVREIQRILRSAKEAQQGARAASPPGAFRWAGTDDLLALLSAAPPTPSTTPSAAAAAAEAQDDDDAGEPGPPPPPAMVLGSLEQLMDHPHFVSRCLEAALPPNLGHCLRLMRVIELENAAPSAAEEEAAGTTTPPAALTMDATARIARLLVRLCQEGTVVEQLRHHLEGLFKLTTASYPPTGVHIQAAAYQVVEAISSRALSSSLVWFIHDRQIVMQMTDDMMELCQMGGSRDEDEGVGGGPTPRTGPAALERVESLSDCLLSGPAAEAAGMWLVAAKAVVTLVCNSCRYSAALVSDLQEARGYDVLRFVVRRSAPGRRPELLAGLAQLVGAGAETHAERSANASGTSPKVAEDVAALGSPARNLAAFEVLRDVMIEATPVLQAVLTSAAEGKAADDEGAAAPRRRDAPALQPPSAALGAQAPVVWDLGAVARQAIEFLRGRARGAAAPPRPEEAEREELQLQLLGTLLQVYSNHPRNYALLEPKFQVLSLYLACLSSFHSPDLKLMVIKTLEYVCSGVANCAPSDALHAASYTFMACCETFLLGPEQAEDAAVARELHDNVEMVCATLEKLIQFDHQFVEVLGTTGVLRDLFYPLLARAVQVAGEAAVEQDLARSSTTTTNAASMTATPSGVNEVVCLACRILTMMLQETPSVASRFFREVRLQQVVYAIIGELGFRSTLAALRVLQLAALADEVGLRDDLTCLIELLQSCRHERWRQLVVLKAIKDILTSDSVANELWRSFCGFEAAVAALSSLDGAFVGPVDTLVDSSKGSLVSEEEDRVSVSGGSGGRGEALALSTTSTTTAKDFDETAHLHAVLEAGKDQEICLELLKQIIRTITIAISGKVLGNLRARVENRQYLKNEIGYDTIKCCLFNSKVLTRERFSREIVECIFMMVTEEAVLGAGGRYHQATVKNADAALLLFSLLTELPRSVATYILQKLLQLIANSTYVAAEQLCLAGALRQVLVQFYDILNDPEDPLYGPLLRLLYLSGRHRVTVPDTISMLRCLAKPLFLNKDGAIVLCPSFRRQVALHPELAGRKRAALEEQWKSLLILAELAETSDSVPFLRLGGGRGDLLALGRKWACEEPKEIGIMDFDEVYAAMAYSEGMRFVMVPTVGGAQPSASSSGFTYSCWFRFGVEATDFVVSSLDEAEKAKAAAAPVPGTDPLGEDEGGVTQEILWLFTVSSTSAKSSLQVYLDLTHRQLCVESYVGKGLDTELIPVDLAPGQWHHFLLVHRRARNLLSNTKNTLAVFLNGVEVVESFKTDHISFLESQTSRCFIGVPLPDTLKVNESVLRGAVAPIWHMGPILLTLEALPVPQAATAIYASGPSYVGSFQGERPVHSNIHAIVTALLARLHRGSCPTARGGETIAALLARGLQDVLRMDHRSNREEEALVALLSLRIPLEHVVFSFHAGHASTCEMTPRKLSGTAYQNLDIYHEPCYRLVNTIGHLAEDARAQWGVVFGDGALMNPLSISDSVFGIAGPQVLFPLLEVADSPTALCVVLELVRVFCRGHTANLDYMQTTGYRVMVFLLARKKHLFTPDVLRACVALAIDTKASPSSPPFEGGGGEAAGGGDPFSSSSSSSSSSSPCSKLVVDAAALKHLVLNWELWGSSQDRAIVLALLVELNGLLVPQNPNAVFNAYRLHYLGLVRWTLSVMMQAAKLSSAGQEGGWLLPRVTLEDAHWARVSSSTADELLNLCGELLQHLLLTRMAENDVNDMASVLLSTVAQRPGGPAAGSGEGAAASKPPAAGVVNVSALNGSREVLSPQSIVRIYLLEILIKVLTREHDRHRKTGSVGGHGVVKKVMDFFSLESSNNLLAATGGGGPGATGGGGNEHDPLGPSSGGGASAAAAAAAKVVLREDRQEILKALSKCLSPDWFHSMLAACRDALSISLTLRALFILFQERDDFLTAFAEYDTGFATLGSALPRISASPIVLLPLFAVVVGIPMSQVPALPDLEQSRLYELLELLVAELAVHRLPRPLFGALTTALMEGLNRNVQLSLAGEDAEVTARARYCVEETLEALKGVLEGSVPFMEASKSKEFVTPLVQSLFACADIVDTLQQRKHGEERVLADDADSSSSSALNKAVGGSTSTATSMMLAQPYFDGAEAQRLLLLLTLVLRDSFFTPAGLAGGYASSAQALVREAFLAFPHTAMAVHIYAFYETFLVVLADLIKEALSSGDGIPVGNVVAVSSVLFEVAQQGLLPPALLTTSLELSLKVAREISGTRINKSLGNDLQQMLLADAIAVGQAFSVVALRRSARQCYTEGETDAVLGLISSHLHLLLSHTKRPASGGLGLGAAGSSSMGGGGGSTGGGLLSGRAGSSAVSNQGKWRKAFASSMSLDEAGMDAAMAGASSLAPPGGVPSAPLDLSKSMTSISSMMLSRPLDSGAVGTRMHDLCQQFGPDKDEPFVVCLLTELRAFLVSPTGEDGRRRTAARVCEVLLKQRQNLMAELLSPEVKDKQGKGGGKEKKVLDVYGKGFLPLLGQDVDAEEAVRLGRFEDWCASAEAAEDIQQVFALLQDRAVLLLPDDATPTPDVLNRLQAAKVPAFSLGQSSAHARLTRGEQLNVRKAFETFINFHQHIIRSGLADMANGSMHWKKVLRSLRGVASVWEGVDLFEGKQKDKWATANAGAKEAATQSLHQNFRWKLDMTEGPERMRRRLKRNFEFEEVFNVLECPVLDSSLPVGVVAALVHGDSSTSSGGERPSLPPSISSSSLEGLLQQDADFDLRATTKLIKQVALVHKNSGVGTTRRGEIDDDDEDLFDMYGEEATVAAGEMPGGLNRAADDSQPILNVDMTQEGEEEEGGPEGEAKANTSAADPSTPDVDRSGSLLRKLSLGGRTRSRSGSVGSEGRQSSSLALPGATTTGLPDDGSVDLGATSSPFHDNSLGMQGTTRTSLAETGASTLAETGAVLPCSSSAELLNRDGSLQGSSAVLPTPSTSALPPALRTQVFLDDIEGADHLNASGSLALMAMEAAAMESREDFVANELIAGFVDDTDGPILRLYNVQRCTGLEVRPALLLVCRHAIVMVDSFAKVENEEGGPSSGTRIKRVPLAVAPSSSSFGVGGGNATTTTTTTTTITITNSASTGTAKLGGEGGAGSSNAVAPSSASTEDLGNRFNVYMRAPNTKDGERRPSAEALRINKAMDAPPSSLPARPVGMEEEASGSSSCNHASRIGFDLENPPHVERMRFDRLRILYKRRYQFRHVAIEFFDVDGRSFLVALETPEEQGQVVDLVLDAPIVNSVFWQQEGALHKLGGGGRINYKRFMAHWRQQLTSRWQSGRMTNFEYLMHLNALAGRSFHDLTQYPVFPWVLSDYTSAELDLTNPSVYRDLRKPMGALGESRAKQFRERFEQLASLVEDMSPEEAAGEAPPFHYGTHYSCAGYVLYYLLRLEPYARLHLQLQGGKFDKADRLFRDIKSSWDSASRENLQDVRELIPEFFYLPEFLTNHNQFDYGWLQKGVAVNHVMLPPWAKGDAREFVRLQRMALESKYVSENLCHWIDLIFGSKQTGPEAVEAQNLFVHLTYEGVVDIDAIEDPVIREATVAQIHNFGQTPSRLFKRPHPARRVPMPLQHFQPASDDGAGGGTAGGGSAGSSGGGNTTTLPRHVDPSALAWHHYTTPSLCVVGAPQTIALRVSSTSQLGAPYGGAVSTALYPGGALQPVGDVWAVKDRAMGVGLDCALVPPNLVKYARYGSPDYGLAFRVAVPTTRHQYVDRVVSVHEQLHLGAVNCLAVDEAGELAVTGSKDSTVRVWSLAKQQSSSSKTLALQATLCGHSNEVLCVDVAAQLGLLLSGGADRLAVAWDVRDFTSLRLLVGHTSPVTSVSINKRTGDMVTLGGVDVRVWNIMGEPLAQVSAIAVVKEVPTCAVATDCPEWLNGVVAVTGHDNGKLCLWALQDLAGGDDPATVVVGTGGEVVEAASADTSSGGGGRSSSDSDGEKDVGSNTGTTKGRQLKVMQILQGVHTAAVTAVRVGREQRDLAVGDAMGRCSKWTSVRLDQLPERELLQLAASAAPPSKRRR